MMHLMNILAAFLLPLTVNPLALSGSNPPWRRRWTAFFLFVRKFSNALFVNDGLLIIYAKEHSEFPITPSPFGWMPWLTLTYASDFSSHREFCLTPACRSAAFGRNQMKTALFHG